MTGKTSVLCSHRYLMTLYLTNYNNLLSLKASQAPEERKKEVNFIAFVTEIKQELSEFKKEKKIELLSYVKT